MSSFELDHIGIAVRSLEEATPFYKALGFKEMSFETVESEGVKIGFYTLENKVRIELLEAYKEESPIFKFIQKKGPGLHHICLKVKNLNQTLKNLKASHIKLIDEEPRKGACHKKVAFIHPKSTGGVLFELSEA